MWCRTPKAAPVHLKKECCMNRCGRLAAVMFVCTLFLSASVPAGIRYGILPSNADPAVALQAWNAFKTQGLTAQHTPGPNMLRQFWKEETRGEYQAWALVLAVMHNDHETAKKLWNFCEYYVPRQSRGMIPWRIYQDPDTFEGPVIDADVDYAIALDMAARKWPDYKDDQGKSWHDWAVYYINSIYDYRRAITVNPQSPNAITGKGVNPNAKF